MSETSFDPKLFLDFAQSILNDSTVLHAESCARVAASRAYYCVYHICNNVASNFPTKPHQNVGGVHRRLIGAFQNCTSHLPQETQIKLLGISYILDQARQNRVDADYHLDREFTIDKAKTCICSTKKVIEKLEESKLL